MSERQVIACQPTTWVHHDDHVPGTKPIIADCGHEVWVAPSTLTLMETDQSYTTMCIPCLMADPEFKKEHPEFKIHPTQRQELDETLGSDATANLLRTLRINER